MESIIQSSSDTLVDALSYKLSADAASYVTDREECVFHANAATYSGDTGVKVIRFNLSGHGFLDLSSLVFQWKITNNNAANINSLTPSPGCFISRFTLRMGGAVVEDIQQANRLDTLINLTLPMEKRLNIATMGFYVSGTDVDTYHGTLNFAGEALAPANTLFVCWSPSLISGLCAQSKYIPLFALPSPGITIDLELARGTECIRTTAAQPAPTYIITEAVALVNCLQVDSNLAQSYSEHLLSGSHLNIPYRTFVAQQTAVTTSDFAITMARSFTRLVGIFVTLYRAPPAADPQPFSIANYFYGGASAEHAANPISGYLQIGSKRWPQSDIVSLRQFFMRLLAGLGVKNSATHAINIHDNDYGNHAFIALYDTERVPQAQWSGHNVSTGGQVTVNFKNVGTDAGSYAQSCIMYAHHDAVVQIADQGVTVLT